MTKRIAVIGAGFAGLSVSAHLAKKGYKVTVYEKNNFVGGRGHQRNFNGFIFDMGPSWYWMPEVFEEFFNAFGKKASDYYELVRLDPSYRVCFGQNDFWNIPANLDEMYALFESKEKGSSVQLKKFLSEAKYKYDIGMGEFVHKPSLGIGEFIDSRILKSLFKMQLLTSISSHIKKHFKNEQLIKLLEFPVLFLGAKPKDTPALYSMMNYADIVLGTWYPMGGMVKVAEGMMAVGKEQGVEFRFNANVEKINSSSGKANSIQVNGETIEVDAVVGAGDYHFIDQKLVQKEDRSYSASYWDSRKLAPSCLMYYIGVNKKLKNMTHHTLFFDTDFNKHSEEIYDRPQWPTSPLFYTSVASITDPVTAPDGMDNLVILIPVAPGLVDTAEVREQYYNVVMERLEKLTEQSIRPHVVVKETMAYNDYVNLYNSFKGNAYGLANTLMQTAFLKPSMKSKKIKNIYYAGQLTVPGPGVPPTIISGKVAADLIEKEIN